MAVNKNFKTVKLANQNYMIYRFKNENENVILK